MPGGRAERNRLLTYRLTCTYTHTHTRCWAHACTHSMMTAFPILNITSKHIPVSLSEISPILVSCWSLSRLPTSYLRWRELTHSVVGLRCALPNDELCIGRCHFEKCNYLSDKADGPVLSGICCASIKSVLLENELQAHKHGCVNRFPYAFMNNRIHMHINKCTHASSLANVCCLGMLLRHLDSNFSLLFGIYKCASFCPCELSGWRQCRFWWDKDVLFGSSFFHF